MKTTQIKIHRLIAALFAMMALMCVTNVQAVNYTATATGNWTTGSTWSPSGPPTSSDTATINSTVNVTVSTTAPTCSSLTVNYGGIVTEGGGTLTVNGNAACYGQFLATSQSAVLVLAGSSSTMSGTWSNEVVTVNGTYTLTAGSYLLVGAANTGISGLLGGTGSLVNNGTIVMKSGLSSMSTPSTLTFGSASDFYFQGASVGAGGCTFPGLTYNNVLFNNTGSQGPVLSTANTAINGFLDLKGGGAPTWPSTLTLGGLLWEWTTAGTVTPTLTLSGNAVIGSAYASSSANSAGTITVSGTIGDGGHGYSLTKVGFSTNSIVGEQVILDPSASETFSGGVNVNGGILTLNYANLGSTANFFSTSQALQFGNSYLGAGALVLEGLSGKTETPTFTGLTLNNGAATVSNYVNSATSLTTAVGGITRSAGGGTVDFGNSAAGGTITTTTANNSAGILGGWATYKTADFAADSGSSPYAIGALGSYTTLPVSGSSSTTVYTTASTTLSASESAGGVKLTGTGTALAVAGNTLTTPALLITGSCTASQSGSGSINNGSGEIIVNVAPAVSFNAYGNTIGGTGSGNVTKTGAGVWNFATSGNAGPADTGTLTVNEGEVGGNASSLGFTTIVLENGGSVRYNSGAPTFSGTLSGNGYYGGGNANLFGSAVKFYPGGNGTPGTLYLGHPSGDSSSVNIPANATFYFDLSNDPMNTNANDQVIFPYASGSCTYNGAIYVNINLLNSTLGAGTYTLLDNSFGGVGTAPSSINVTFTPSGSAPSSYTCAFGTGGSKNTSNGALLLTVYNPAPACQAATATTPTASPSGGVCAGTSVTFTETPSGGTSPYSYQWYTNGTLVTGATSSTFTYVPISGDTINCTAASTCNGTVSTPTALTETVYTGPTAGTPTPSPSGTVCSGTTVTFTSAPSGGSGTYSSYAWYKNGTLVAGQTASTYAYAPANNDVITYTVTDSHGCSSSLSSGVTETVTTTPNQPTALTPTAGNGSVTLNWTAPSSGATPTAYNIYRSAANGTSGSETLLASPSGTGTSYTDSTVANGSLYYYKVTALNGSCESAFSGAPETSATPNPAFVAYTITDSASGSVAAGGSDTLTISAVDGGGNLVSGVSGNIILTFSGLSAAPGGKVATVGGVNQGSATTLNFSGGQATAALLAYGASGSAQTLSVADAGSAHTSASPGQALSLTVSPAAESQLGFPTKPGSTGNAGVVFATQPIISILDQYGNVVDSTDTVGVTANLGNVSPSGSTNIAAVAGTATFSGLYLTNTGSTTLTFTDTTTTLTTTNAVITMSAGAASQLVMKTQPSSTVAAGTALATQPAVYVEDAYHNLTTSNAVVTVTPSVGNATPNSVTAASGTATCSGLYLTNNNSGSPITLTFSSTGMTSATSSGITVSGGSVAGVAWTTQPAGAVYGSAFTTQPVLKTVDQYGNPTTTGVGASLPVTISGSVALVSGATTSYDLGTSHGNGTITGVGLGFAAGTGTSPTLTATVAGYGTTPPVSGYTFWLDASQSSSVAQNNSSVTTWNDVSGNGHNFGTKLGSGTINTTTHTLNGHDVVTFPGTVGLDINLAYNSGNSVTVFTVANAANSTGYQRVFSTESGGQDYSSPGCFEMDVNNQTKADPSFQRDSSFDTYSTGVNDGTPFIWFGAENGATGEYVDADTGSGPLVAVPGQADTTLNASGNFAITQMAVGCGDNNGGYQNGWNGDIAEVVFFESYLTTAQQSQMYTYLENKWFNNNWPYNSSSVGASGVSATSSGVLVSPATVTITSGLSILTRIANSTFNATLLTNTSTGVTLSGVLTADQPNVTLVTNGYVANFAQTNAGTGIAVTVSGLNLGGTTATNNYTLTQPTGLTGTISPIPTYSAFILTDSGSGSAQAGVTDYLTITAVNSSSVTASTFNGPVAITFSGLSTGTDGSYATINGSSINGAITITFTNGVSVVPLVAHAVQSSATLSAADSGGNSTANTGGAPLTLNVAVGPDSAYRISANTGTPTVGASDSLTITVVDQYQNQSADTGSQNITFGGLSISPNGTAPTVNGTAFGTATAVTFSGGTASVPLVATTVESSKTLSAANGAVTTTATGGTAPVFSPTATATAASLAVGTEPSSSAVVGVVFAQQPVVKVLDAYGNASTAGSTVTANAGSFNLNSTGTLTATANGSGNATFSGLYLTNTGSITLNFTSSGLTSTNSTAISVGGAAITQLIWGSQPGAGADYYDTAFGTTAVIETADQYGNPSTNGLPANMNITITKTAGGGTLIGTTTYNIGVSGSNGVVTCSGLGIKGVSVSANDMQLTATAAAGYGTPPAGMAIWLDANNPASVVNSGGNVTAWNDVSGNGNNFAPQGGTPTYASSTISGETARKVVTFTGSDEVYNSAFKYTGAGATNLSTFIVFRLTSTATGYGNMHGTYDGSHNDYQSYNSYCIDLGPSDNTARLIRNESNCGDATVGTGTYTTSYNYASMLMNYGTNEIWVNSGTGAVGGCNGNDFNIQGTAVGGGLTGTGGPRGTVPNEIAEFLMYTNDETANRAAIEGYLSNKWLAGSSVPTYATPPTAAVSTNFTVNPLPLVVGTAESYNGLTTLASSGLTISNLVGGDTVTMSGNVTFASSNAGPESITSFSSVSLGGAQAADYTLSGASGTVTINPLAVSITGTRAYDTTATANAGILSVANEAAGDNLTLGGSVGLAGAGVGVESINNFTSLTLGGTSAGNYTQTGESGSVTVSPANATVVVTPYDVAYDGNPHSAAITSITGVGGETGSTVGTVNVSGTTHTAPGTYSSDYWTFTGTANYNNISAQTITDMINKATAAVSGTSATNCSGTPITLTATLTGIGPWNVTWSDGHTDTGVSSPDIYTPSPTATTTYTVTAMTDTGSGYTAQPGDLTGSVTATVNNVTANAASLNVIEGASFKITIATLLSLHASDPANDTLSLAGVGTDGYNLTTTSGFNLVTNSTYILYTNNLTTGNTDTFKYTAFNSCGSLATNTVTFTVVAGTGQRTGSLTVSNGVVILTFYGVPGDQYDIEGSPDMIQPWTNIPGSPFTAYTNGLINATDAPAGSSEYYQLTTP